MQVENKSFPYNRLNKSTGVKRLLQDFRDDESGGIIVMTILLLVTMLVIGGMAVDFMRFESRRVQLQSVSDRAVLAAASLDQILSPEDVVADYFLKAGFDGSIVGTPQIVNSGNARTVHVESALNLNTFYLRLVGIDTLRAPAQSAALEGVGKVEISLVLDISGSMRYGGSTGSTANGGRGRFGDMQDAAIAFANKVLDPDNGGQVSLTIVPYAGMTNPGPQMFDYLNANRYSLTGTVNNGNGNGNGNGSVNTADLEDLTEASSCLEIQGTDWTHSGLPAQNRTQVPHFMNWGIAADVMDWGWCPQDRSAIQYAFRDAAAAAAFINGIRMHDGTGTHYAMKYGLAMLDPDTQPAFQHLNDYSTATINTAYEAAVLAGDANAEDILDRPKLVPDEFANRPAAWDDVETKKILVLMTDGKITEQVRPNDPLAEINLTEELKNQGDASSFEYSARTTNRDNFYAICDFAKSPQRDVEVYTVAFETDATGRTEMARCASSSATFFPASGAGLTTVFEEIADQITDLRLNL